MKKILLWLLLILWIVSFTYWAAPEVNCIWIPWCTDTDVTTPNSPWDVAKQFNWFKFLGWFISELIKYVAVVAVISIMISWIMYIISIWDEEKTKKAKSWIIWSLVWVFVSISAFWIVEVVNSINFN